MCVCVCVWEMYLYVHRRVITRDLFQCNDRQRDNNLICITKKNSKRSIRYPYFRYTVPIILRRIARFRPFRAVIFGVIGTRVYSYLKFNRNILFICHGLKRKTVYKNVFHALRLQHCVCYN